MRKAIVCYVDNRDVIINEFDWLYKTWFGWCLYNEYDLVAFKHPEAVLKWQHPNLVVINMPPHQQKPEWQNYPWVNSFAMFEESHGFEAKYSHIMRTDADVFLTKSMLGVAPRKCMFGVGTYHFDNPSSNVLNDLRAVQVDWGLGDNSLRHVGSTIFGPANKVIQYTKLQYQLTKRLLAEKFPDGEGQWPHWYRGVASMYGGFLAANQLFTHDTAQMWCLDDSPYGKPIDASMLHIHAWPGPGDFNKHKFHNGGYSPLILEKLPTRTDLYCHWVATNTPEVIQAICQSS